MISKVASVPISSVDSRTPPALKLPDGNGLASGSCRKPQMAPLALL